MKLDRTSYFRVFGALSAALLIADQSHAQPAVYPAVTAEQLEHPDASDQAEKGGTRAGEPPVCGLFVGVLTDVNSAHG